MRPHQPHRAAQLGASHTVGPDQIRGAARADQIDYGVAVTEDMNMCRQVIISKDDNT